jgi:predicted ATP-grasp superfamily ATP-dependent carboligase
LISGTRTFLRKSSSPERGCLLLVAISGRALAAAAVRAGFVPLVADFFADADTTTLAHACARVEGELGAGFSWPQLNSALTALVEAAPASIAGLIYGAGFEDRPELIARLARRWTLLGNDARTVARIKSPEQFFAALDELGIPHPHTVLTAQAAKPGWLAKRCGGAGGGHIRSSVAPQADASLYFQERVRGRPVSALFVANGRQAGVLGFSEQWTAPMRGRPFRYGGAVRDAELEPQLAEAMTDAVARVAASFALKGLGSADFMVRGDEALLLEINPRPGATLDIFDTETAPLLGLHLEAVRGGPRPREGLALEGAAASAIVFATKALTAPEIPWLDWAADRPKAGERIDKGRPICTVLAGAHTPAEAKGLVEERISIIRAACRGRNQGVNGEFDEKNGGERNAPHGGRERQRQGRAAPGRARP